MSSSSSLALLQDSIDYRFQQVPFLRQALTHRSFSVDHNERLEFLGDGILNMVVAIMLFETFPSLREGELSRLRAKLVRQDTLAEIALELDLGSMLLLGEGEQKSGGRLRPSILADAVEAMLGAVFLDGGFDAARALVLRLYKRRLAELDPGSVLKDPKTALQEYLQARRLPLPHYVLAQVGGEAHAQQFEVACEVAALAMTGKGRGSSRRVAEQSAASDVLARLDVSSSPT